MSRYVLRELLVYPVELLRNILPSFYSFLGLGFI